VRRRRRERRRGSWAPLVLCLVLALLPLSLRQSIRGMLLDAHGAIHSFLGGRAPQEDSASGDQLALLEAELVSLRQALASAGTAQEVVAFDQDVDLIPAEVLPLAGSADALLHRVALARGRQDGVAVGMAVLAYGGRVLVGRVAAVARGTCEVRLVTDPQFRLRAVILRAEGNVEGLLRGDGRRLYFEPALLDETAPAPEPRSGERLFCSRASVLCGQQALIGVVHTARRLPGATLQGAVVTPARSLKRLEHVLIVRADDTA
jgi:cell shape-determining protein MreC